MVVFFGLNNILLAIMAIVFVLSRKYRHLFSIPLYAVVSLLLSFLYQEYFYNWTFYLTRINVATALFMAILFEILYKDLEKFKGWMLSAYVVFVIILILPLSVISKVSIPFTIANIVFILGVYYGYKEKHPILLIMGIASGFSFLIDVAKVLVDTETIFPLLETCEMYTFPTMMVALILIALWSMFWPPFVKAAHKFFNDENARLNKS